MSCLNAQGRSPSRPSPQGTVLAAEKAADNRALARVPFFQIIPTALKVTDFSNSGFSGAGWEVRGRAGAPFSVCWAKRCKQSAW